MLIGENVAVRDSKSPDEPSLRFPKDAWSAFIASLREGDFQFK
jgi:hypothetical protein